MNNNALIKPLVIRTNMGDTFFDYQDIVRIEASGSRTFIYNKKGEKLTSPTCISELEMRLPEKTFFRCHRSHIVNISYILNYNGKTGKLTVNDTEVPISKNFRQKFLHNMCGL